MAGQIQRRASHAGSWYAASKKELNYQLENWLQAAGPNTNGPARAIISPHAGYQYCGACAAHAYKEICPTTTKRIFILGPSHHIHLSGCALSPASVYKTPFYDLVIDRDIYEELYASSAFEEMTLYADEDEHSIEMQLSFIAKVMEPVGSAGFKIVPILVGSLSSDKEEMYGRLLSKYLADPANVFVISSDFCHWGARFSYQYYDKGWGEIYESIQKLDEMGMNQIESLDPSAFSSYLKKYRNTICGRHPIAVLLNAIAHLRNSSPPSSSNHVVMNGHHSSNHVNNNHHHVNGIGGGSKSSSSSSSSSSSNNNNAKFEATLRFLNYAQSSQCLRMRDSSVSYASATLKINN